LVTYTAFLAPKAAGGGLNDAKPLVLHFLPVPMLPLERFEASRSNMHAQFEEKAL
jgi:hypothetical protein